MCGDKNTWNLKIRKILDFLTFSMPLNWIGEKSCNQCLWELTKSSDSEVAALSGTRCFTASLCSKESQWLAIKDIDWRTTTKLPNRKHWSRKHVSILIIFSARNQYVGVTHTLRYTHLSIIWLAIVLQPLWKNISRFVGSQVFCRKAHALSKQRRCQQRY